MCRIFVRFMLLSSKMQIGKLGCGLLRWRWWNNVKYGLHRVTRCYNLGCIGHARYATAEEASAAKSTLNGADLCGSSIVVDSWEKGRQDWDRSRLWDALGSSFPFTNLPFREPPLVPSWVVLACFGRKLCRCTVDQYYRFTVPAHSPFVSLRWHA